MSMPCGPEELLEFRDRLARSAKLIIVEGPKDMSSLRAISVTNPILMLSKKPLYAVAEQAASLSKDIVILTDLDTEGKKLFGRLSTDLQHLGCRIDNTFREFLFKKTKLRQIEGIKTYLESSTSTPRP